MRHFLVVMLCLLMLTGIATIACGESETTPDEAALRNAVEQLKQFYSTEIIMGTPREVNGLKIIPLATVGIGYGQHIMPENGEGVRGTGGVLNPVAIIVVSENGKVQLIQLSKGFAEQVMSALAPVILQLIQARPGDNVTETGGTEGQELPIAATKPSISGTLASAYARFVGFFLLGWVALILIIEAFLPQHVNTVAATLRQNYLRSGLIGLVGSAVVLMMVIVFALSIVGIPFTLVFAGIAKALALFGTAGLALIVGQRAATAFGKPDYSAMACVLIGGIILGIVGLIPILGWIVLMIVGFLGFGAVLQIQWQQVKKQPEDNV